MPNKEKKPSPLPQREPAEHSLKLIVSGPQALPVFRVKRISENLLSYLSVPFSKIPADIYV